MGRPTRTTIYICVRRAAQISFVRRHHTNCLFPLPSLPILLVIFCSVDSFTKLCSNMVDAQLARTVVGIIGNVVSFGLFLSPIHTFVRIIKKKDVEEFQPYPYMAAVMNCMTWVLYGTPFITPNSILVITINGIGLGIELIYLSIFVYYDRKNKGRKKVLYGILGEVILLAAIALIAKLAFHTQRNRNLFVGVFADIFNIIMYASPLAVMNKVRKTKSVEYMPLWLSVANLCNGSIWTAYAFIKVFDPFLLVSNGLGAIFAVFQLLFYAWYASFTPNDTQGQHDSTLPKSEIQITQTV
ncbi:Putative bidirectional sugar transporter SWEET7d [Linum grandiflorum]